MNATKEKFGFQSLLEEAVWLNDSIKDAMQMDKDEHTHDILDLVSETADDQSAVQSEFFRDLFDRDHSDEPIAQVPFALFPCPLSSCRCLNV